MCRADLPLTLSTAWQSIMLLQQRLRFASSMDGLDCLCRLADEPRPSTSDPATMKEASLSQRSGEDHAQGMAAMPPSSNAPKLPQHAPRHAAGLGWVRVQFRLRPCRAGHL